MKKVTLWKEPITFVKAWFQLKCCSMLICGKMSGIRLYPNGTIVLNDEKVVREFNKHAEEVEDLLLAKEEVAR